jgi:hypothetical protein
MKASLSTRLGTFTLALASAVMGCVNPNAINPPNGGECNPTVLDGCPPGFRCDRGSATCQRFSSADASADVHVTDAAASLPDVSVAADGTAADGIVCVMPIAGCTPEPGKLCDPVCQTGCGCTEKCSVSTPSIGPGVLTCNRPSGTLVRQVGQSCTIVAQDKPTQTDDCVSGLVCLQGLCGSSCFKHCKVDADCGGKSTCTRTLPGGFKFCDVEPVACNPVTALGPTGCPGDAQGCYLSATVADETRCDCPFAAQKQSEPCAVSRDCLPGLVCAAPNGQNNYSCQVACILTASANGCRNNDTCHPINGSASYGYCEP